MRISRTSYVRGLLILAAAILTSCGGGGGGAAGDASPPIAATCAVNSVACDETAHAVTASVGTQGATLTSPSGGVQVVIPPNAIASTTVVSVAPSTESMTQGNLGAALQLSPGGINFAVPVILRMKYDPAALPEGMQERELTISMATPDGWVAVPTTVDQVNKELVASLSHFSTYAATNVPDASAVFGMKLGEFDGVEIRSNGSNTYDSNTRNETGLTWQCVEFVNRYYLQKRGKTIRYPSANAKDYFNTASQRGLQGFENNGGEAPKVGDIIVSEGGPAGHVAVVKLVQEKSITVVHQNWTNGRLDAAGRELAFNKATNKVSAFNGTYGVRGWLRVPEVAPADPVAPAAVRTFEPELSADGVRIGLPSSASLIRFSGKSAMACTSGPGSCNPGAVIDDFIGGTLSSAVQPDGLVNVTLTSKTGQRQTGQYDSQLALVKDFLGCTYEPRVQMAAAVALSASYTSRSTGSPVVVTRSCPDGTRVQTKWTALKVHSSANSVQSTTWIHNSYDLSGKWLSQIAFAVSVDTAGPAKLTKMLLMSLYDYPANVVFDVTLTPP